MKWDTCTQEVSISELTYMYSITFNSDMRYMYLSRFDIVKYITSLQKASIKRSNLYAIKMVQYTEEKYI